MANRALSFLDNLSSVSSVADLGCGTGTQTIFIAQNTPGTVVGVDLIPSFIDILSENAN
jgi:methylase of polypeptide subunit release factors